ncbi:MAG: alanine racemase [Betaproteobacteria bacterium]
MERPIQASILTENLKNNLNFVRSLANDSKIWSVIKANAYGHGIREVYAGLKETDGFALLDIKDACLLREIGWAGPVLLLEGIFAKDELNECYEKNIDIVIHHSQQMSWLSQWLNAMTFDQQTVVSQKICIWLKLNSGMNRLGLNSQEYLLCFKKLRDYRLKVNHLTHFANADEIGLEPSVESQMNVFAKVIEDLSGDVSTANSAAVLWHHNTHFDWVRPGIMLYGASPTGISEDIQIFGLKPAMNLSSKIISVQDLNEGDRVGYGGQYTATSKIRVGIVACGYADGYPRVVSNGTQVWVSNSNSPSLGFYVKTIGRVSMDMITVDITNHKTIGVGSDVELWGEHVPVDTVAKCANTVGYELLCAIAPRVKRVVV